MKTNKHTHPYLHTVIPRKMNQVGHGFKALHGLSYATRKSIMAALYHPWFTQQDERMKEGSEYVCRGIKEGIYSHSDYFYTSQPIHF